MNSRVIKKLKADGWYLDRIRGSHHHFIHDVKRGVVTVPHPKHDLKKGTLRSIYKQAGLEWPPK